MIRLIVAAVGAIGLILFVGFVASRLARARRSGISIRMQIFLALASIVGAFALGLGLLVIERVEARTTLLAEESARAEATAIAAMVAGEMEARGTPLEQVSEKLRAVGPEGAIRADLLDANDNLVFRKGPPVGEPNTVQVSVPIVVHGAMAGKVRVVKPTIVIRRMLENLAPTVLVLSLILGAAAAASAALIGRSIARPIEGLTDFAEEVSEGRLVRAPKFAPGREVQKLTRALDSMRRQLEGRPFVETFAADLSHELKNPVAAIRASAEVLADGAIDEPEQAERFVRRILESTARIEHLLGDLLSLARIEARGVEDRDPVELTEIAAEVAGAGEQITCSSEGPFPFQVRGDRGWLRRAVENLVDNAQVHGSPEAEVCICITRTSSDVVLSVTNEGRVSPHVEKQLFRRFVTTRGEKGGTGLGLAIVRAVAEAHGGSAKCDQAGPPKVQFSMILPRV